MTHPAELLLLALVALVVLLVGVGVRALIVVHRLLDRSARLAWRSLRRSPQSRLGSDRTPDEMAAALAAGQDSVVRGPQGGLVFSRSGCPGRLDFIAGRTEIRFDLGGRRTEPLEVSTPSFMTRLAEDDPEAFRVRGNPELYHQVFSRPGLVRSLRDLGADFEWRWGPSGYYLEIRSLPGDEEELGQWLAIAFALLEAVPGFAEDPPAPFTPLPPAVLSQSYCQVCGGSLGVGAVVYCRRCATPHHEDCWSYAGVCSTFACRERRSRRAPSA